jgi:signal transduction histidine kinase
VSRSSRSDSGPVEPELFDRGDILKRLGEALEQLAQLRQQVTETQRLATIGTIAAVIAHEFNNLLTPVISYAQYALSSAESEKPDLELIRKALHKTCQGAGKAARICNSMLALARGEGSVAKVSVQSLIDETLLVLARDPAKDGIALRVQVQPDLCVFGDAVQLEQVLLNLLINARQAMLGKGGSITIKASAAEDGQARIQVIDTGPGIPEKVLPRIFEPFFTTKGTAKRGEPRGTGLGLAICREIMAHHRGRIDVESTVGKGTTFSLHLPLA